jgi:mRNA-degrading endonuclease toxin of MazEF toxin-antitoxin module
MVYTPGQPDDPHQPRPGLIISENVRNIHQDDVIVAPIFSEGALGPTRVGLPAGEGGIPHESVIFCEEITTIHHELVADGPLGSPVSGETLRQTVLGVRRAIGDVIPIDSDAALG